MKYLVRFDMGSHALTFTVEAPTRGDAIVKGVKMLDDFNPNETDQVTNIHIEEK